MLKRLLKSLIGAVLTAVLAASPIATARAQDVTGIANADVRAGYRALSLRIGYLTPDDGRPPILAGQFNYQHNFSETFGVQGAALFTRIDDARIEFRGFQTQMQWQFAENETAGLDGSLSLISRIPDGDDGPARVALVAAGKWTREDWELRAMLALPVEFGERARAGVGLVARGEVTRRIGAVGRFGAQFSDNFNTTAHFGAFREQNHQLGPVFKKPVGRHLMATAVALIGLSRAAPDVETKLFLTYEF
ncbi:MAG: hypothetical protein ABL957_00655 [Parvularculaceae bacterium]